MSAGRFEGGVEGFREVRARFIVEHQGGALTFVTQFEAPSIANEAGRHALLFQRLRGPALQFQETRLQGGPVLLREAADHAERVALEAELGADVDALGLPRITLPSLTGGVEDGGIGVLADELVAQGVR